MFSTDNVVDLLIFNPQKISQWVFCFPLLYVMINWISLFFWLLHRQNQQMEDIILNTYLMNRCSFIKIIKFSTGGQILKTLIVINLNLSPSMHWGITSYVGFTLYIFLHHYNIFNCGLQQFDCCYTVSFDALTCSTL